MLVQDHPAIQETPLRYRGRISSPRRRRLLVRGYLTSGTYLCNRTRDIKVTLDREKSHLSTLCVLHSAPIAVVRKCDSISASIFHSGLAKGRRCLWIAIELASALQDPLEITFYAIMRAVTPLEIKLRATRNCKIYDAAHRSFGTSRALISSGGRNVTCLHSLSSLRFSHFLVWNFEVRPRGTSGPLQNFLLQY